MRIVCGKTPDERESLAISEIAFGCGILYDTARLLYCRGIDTVEKAKKFLSPSEKDFYDPYLFPDMKRVVDRLFRARDHGEKVLIAGDYDADGICASALLSAGLKEFGIESGVVIPEREDGYGICLNKVRKKVGEKGYGILITVDCGVGERDTIELLESEGLFVIVTDHHEPPDILPDCPVINPKLNNGYAFTGLCGAGVAYKLCRALIGKAADKYLDFVALATVADSMELTDENRSLVHEGLKLFSPNRIRPCFKYLIGNVGGKQITSQNLAYAVAPRVNAGGRMGDAGSALRLFLSADENEIFDLSVKLNGYNIARQAECDEIYRAAKEKIMSGGAYKRRAIMVYDGSWKAGVIGIVAARLVEEFNRPVIVFAGQDGMLKGSARSIDGVNIYEAISAAKDCTVGFGGHSQAAGVSLTEDKFSDFYDRVDEHLKTVIRPEEIEEVVRVEWETDDISVRFAREIDMLEPFGTGNKRPLFALKTAGVRSLPLKAGSEHYSFTAGNIEILDFNGEKDVFYLRLPVEKRIVYEVNYSVYKGRESVKGYLKKIVADYNGHDLNGYCFRNALLWAKSGNNAPIKLTENKEFADGYGTLYIAESEKELEGFDIKNLTVEYFEPLKNGKNSVCVAATSVPECYEKVVYFTAPLRPLYAKGKNFAFTEMANADFYALKTDRGVFSEFFSVLKSMSGREFSDSVDFYRDNVAGRDEKQFVFCTEVFLELGIFSAAGGRLRFEPKVKNALENSKIYRAVTELKGN